MKKILLFILLNAMPLAAQILVTPNVPSSSNLTSDPFLVLAGSARQINVNVTTKALATAYSTTSSVTTITAPNNFTSTSVVTFNSPSGDALTGLNGHSFTVLATGLSLTQFEVNTGSYIPSSGSGSTAAYAVGQCTAGSLTCETDWSLQSSTGGETVTFTDPTHTSASSIAGALPTIQVNVGSVAGNCSMTPASGSPGPYTLSSTVSFDIRATSHDDATKYADFTFLVCANSPPVFANGENSVIIVPFYQQTYKTQSATLQSWVSGCVDQSGTWSILSQPAGGDGALADTTKRDTVFTASVTGEYTMQYAATCNGGTQTAIVYVGPDALPSYPSTPNVTRPTECAVDSTAFTTDYEVGPGKAYANLEALPQPNTWLPGTIIRMWNTDATGTSPTTYNEYLNIQNSGTRTAPVWLCGVPNANGNLPVMEETNATASNTTPSTNKLYGYGGIVLMASSHYGKWQGGTIGPNYVGITGIEIKDANPANSFVTPGGVSTSCPPNYTTSGTTCPWISDAAGIHVESSADVLLEGNDINLDPNGIMTKDLSSSNLWSTVTRNIGIIGNNIHGMFWSLLEHGLYVQSYYLLAEGNKIHDPNPANTSPGSDIKDRGLAGIFRYNYLGTGAARSFDGVEDEDGYYYDTIEGYTYPWSIGDTAGPNVIAGYMESAQNDFLYGNLIFGVYPDEYQIHYAADKGSTMNAKNGTLWYYFNTLDGAEVVFDNATGGGYNTYYQPRVVAQNDVFWTSGTNLAMEKVEPLIFTGLTNMFHTGSMVITTPITGGNFNGNTAHGWAAGCDYTCKWPLTNPLDPHIYSLTAGNYLLTATQPYDGTTMAPISGSPLINAGSALTGLAAQLPVRWQYSVNSGALLARSTASLTIGAVETSPPPTLSSITIAPSSASVGVGRTQSFTATCVYVGGSSSDCTSGVTWASSSTAVATMSGSIATGVSAGTSNITAVSGAVTSNTAVLTVFVVPSTVVTGLPVAGMTIH